MNIRNITVITVLLSILAACQKEFPSHESGAGKMELIIGVKECATRTTSGTDAKESQINSVQAFVFDAAGALETSASATATYVTASVTPGSKRVYVYVNAPTISASGITDSTSLKNKITYLKDNAINGLIAGGCNTVTVSAGVSASVNVPLKRYACKIVLNKVTNFLSLYQSLTINKIYLTNVQTQFYLGHTASTKAWVNKLGYSSSDCNALVYETYNKTINNGSFDNVSHRFYCYQNTSTASKWGGSWSERPTRLVIEATTSNSGTRYYYTLSLPNLQEGKQYNINNFIITREGSTTADDVSSSFLIVATDLDTEWTYEYDTTVEIYPNDASLSVALARWTGGASYTETL